MKVTKTRPIPIPVEVTISGLTGRQMKLVRIALYVASGHVDAAVLNAQGTDAREMDQLYSIFAEADENARL